MSDLNLDLLVYHDFGDTVNPDLPQLGREAGTWFGSEFAGLYVIAVGPPIHDGRVATVVLGHESRPERSEQIRAYVERDSPGDRLDKSRLAH